MNSSQFERYLRKQGIEVRTKKGKAHKYLRNPANGRETELPTHGGQQQLKTGLMKGILKKLGLE